VLAAKLVSVFFAPSAIIVKFLFRVFAPHTIAVFAALFPKPFGVLCITPPIFLKHSLAVLMVILRRSGALTHLAVRFEVGRPAAICVEILRRGGELLTTLRTSLVWNKVRGIIVHSCASFVGQLMPRSVEALAGILVAKCSSIIPRHGENASSGRAAAAWSGGRWYADAIRELVTAL